MCKLKRYWVFASNRKPIENEIVYIIFSICTMQYCTILYGIYRPVSAVSVYDYRICNNNKKNPNGLWWWLITHSNTWKDSVKIFQFFFFFVHCLLIYSFRHKLQQQKMNITAIFNHRTALRNVTSSHHIILWRFQSIWFLEYI